ncbi:MAG: hypothetical protein Q6373_013740 [Candidatus Sigynarchaeota archaeon]
MATPYIVAMKNGIQFPWEKDVNSVLVACPAGNVDFKLRVIDTNTFQIIIIRQDWRCPKHTLNNIISIPIQEAQMRASIEFFPFLFRVKEFMSVALHGNVSISIASEKNSQDAPEINPCDMQKEIDNTDLVINVAGMKRPCAYHRNVKDFTKYKFAPRGLCFMAYYAAYPALLTMLYGKAVPDHITRTCAGTLSRVEFVLERKARWIKPLLDVLEKVLSITPFRLDIIKYQVKLRVVSTKGVCEKHMKEGDSYILGKKGILCPSSFYSLFPAILSQMGRYDRRVHKCTCTSVPCRIFYRVGIKNKDINDKVSHQLQLERD